MGTDAADVPLAELAAPTVFSRKHIASLSVNMPGSQRLATIACFTQIFPRMPSCAHFFVGNISCFARLAVYEDDEQHWHSCRDRGRDECDR